MSLSREAKSATSESSGNRYFRFSNDKGCGQSRGKVITNVFISFDTLGQFTVLCSLIAFQSLISRKYPEHSSVFQTKAPEFASHVLLTETGDTQPRSQDFLRGYTPAEWVSCGSFVT